jgi:hypothetical protein
MSIIAISDSTELLKILYPDSLPDMIVRQQSKFYNNIKKTTQFGGKWREVTLTYAGGAGISGDYGTAYANVSATKEASFAVTRGKLYGITKIEGEAIAGTLSDKMALAKMLEHNIREANKKLQRALITQLWSLGGGAITKMTAAGCTVTNAYFTCSPTSDAVKFEVGDHFNFASGMTTGLRDLGKALTVVAVNAATGVVTFDAAINTVAGVAATDYVFREGTFGKALTGIRGWIPITAPVYGADSFFGVDRGVDVTKLAGIRYDGTGQNHLDAIGDYSALELTLGASTDMVLMSPRDFRKVDAELGGKATTKIGGEVEVGHTGIIYESASGTKRIVAEAFCPQGYALPVTLDDWEMATAGACPSFLDFDGIGRLLRSETTDSVVCRMGLYGNLICNNPGRQGLIKLSPVP